MEFSIISVPIFAYIELYRMICGSITNQMVYYDDINPLEYVHTFEENETELLYVCSINRRKWQEKKLRKA